ncbi:MAG TPA: DUF4124 domain-containing protein [Xanthomonadaceae bacterium]|nr:DUF4124 domain-containing protein [Xanthomonadaceae bacterium]
MAGRLALAASLACCLLLQPRASHAADEVVIYRCTDARGQLTLRDSPCPKGQAQETRSMLRPKDAPPAPVVQRPARAPATDTPPAPPVERVVVVQPPRPLYECVTPDGERYTSDTPEGNPRWVPLWTLGVPVAPYPYPYPGTVGSTSLAITHGNVHITSGRTVVTPPVYGPAAYGAGTWIRDECHALPQAEVCARLRDRRDELDRRFFNAQPSERARLSVEERGIKARLAQDCR